jgi:hypothetical protein
VCFTAPIDLLFPSCFLGGICVVAHELFAGAFDTGYLNLKRSYS